MRKKKDSEDIVVMPDKKPAEEIEKIAVKKVSNTFDNPGGCLWKKPGCPGTKIRIVWSKNTPFFFCECGFDTSAPSKEIYELAEAFGLLDKE